MKNSTRLFVGTHIDSSLFDYIYDDIKKDFAGICKGKWVEQDNLHFTYKFLGDVENSRLDEVRLALRPFCQEYQKALMIRGMGVFPGANRPRVLFARVISENGIVEQLAYDIDQALAGIGFPKEEKPFRAHTTLQRVKYARQPDFKKTLIDYEDYDVGIMNSFKIKLISSRLTPQGPIYKPILG